MKWKYKITRSMDVAFKDGPSSVRIRRSWRENGVSYVYCDNYEVTNVSMQKYERVTDEEALEIDLLLEFDIKTYPKDGQVIIDLTKE